MTEQVLIHGSFADIDPSAFDEVDLLSVDPPFSEHVHKNAVSAGTLGPGSKGYVKRDLGFAALTQPGRFNLVMLAGRVRRWSLFHTDFESVGDWKCCRPAKHPVEYIRCVPWVRWSQPQKSGDRPGQQAEAVVIFHRPGAKHWNGPGSLRAFGIGLEEPDGRFVMRCTSLRGSDKHPTEKPLDLELDKVSWFSDPGEVVADTHMGRGTTGLAARLLGRDFVGVELDAAHFKAAKRRLESTRLDPRDLERAEHWIETTRAEAKRQLAVKQAKDGSDEKTRARAEFRLGEAERLAKALRKAAA